MLVEKPPRVILGQKIGWRFRRYYRRLISPSFVVTISNGRICGTRGTVITDDDNILIDVSREWWWKKYKNQHSIMRQLFLGKMTKLKGNVAIIATEGADNYFHWMLDVLPRFDLLKKADILHDIDYFIVPPLKLPFQIESIRKIGIRTDKLIFSDCNRFHIQAEQLFVPSLPSLLGSHDKWAYEFLRGLFLKKGYRKTKYSKYLFISRKNAKSRRIINEEGVLSVLKPLGFEVLECEKLPIERQAEIFHNAECIIAVQGSGLTNVVFCQENCKIICIYPPFEIDSNMWIISNRLKLAFYCIIINEEKVREFDNPWIGRKADDIFVDLSILKKILERAKITGLQTRKIKKS
ncbi:MAG: glycosyltransferase family 61 protein [Candidatus Scalindua sp.]